MNYHQKAKVALRLARECHQAGIQREAYRLLSVAYRYLKQYQEQRT